MANHRIEIGATFIFSSPDLIAKRSATSSVAAALARAAATAAFLLDENYSSESVKDCFAEDFKRLSGDTMSCIDRLIERCAGKLCIQKKDSFFLNIDGESFARFQEGFSIKFKTDYFPPIAFEAFIDMHDTISQPPEGSIVVVGHGESDDGKIKNISHIISDRLDI